MAREFQVFTGRSTRAAGKEPQAMLHRRGTLSLNKAAYELLGSPERVVLMFDIGSQSIGLRAADPGTRYSYPVRSVSSNNLIVAAQAFTRHHEIPTDVPRAFTPILEDGVLVIELQHGVDIPIRHRGPNKHATDTSLHSEAASVVAAPSPEPDSE